MGLDIFFAEDIRNALLAADEASISTASACGLNEDYLTGYAAALRTVALAFGLSPASLGIGSNCRRAVALPEASQQEEQQAERSDSNDILCIPYRIRE